MTIPGFKLLDEIIAGFPTNSAQRLELAKLRGDLMLKEQKIAELEAEVAALRPKHGLAIDALRILKLLFDLGEPLSSSEIAERFQLKKSVADHHFDVLQQLGLILQSGGFELDDPETYGITAKGRAFVVEKKLA